MKRSSLLPASLAFLLALQAVSAGRVLMSQEGYEDMGDTPPGGGRAPPSDTPFSTGADIELFGGEQFMQDERHQGGEPGFEPSHHQHHPRGHAFAAQGSSDRQVNLRGEPIHGNGQSSMNFAGFAEDSAPHRHPHADHHADHHQRNQHSFARSHDIPMHHPHHQRVPNHHQEQMGNFPQGNNGNFLPHHHQGPHMMREDDGASLGPQFREAAASSNADFQPFAGSGFEPPQGEGWVGPRGFTPQAMLNERPPGPSAEMDASTIGDHSRAMPEGGQGPPQQQQGPFAGHNSFNKFRQTTMNLRPNNRSPPLSHPRGAPQMAQGPAPGPESANMHHHHQNPRPRLHYIPMNGEQELELPSGSFANGPFMPPQSGPHHFAPPMHGPMHGQQMFFPGQPMHHLHQHGNHGPMRVPSASDHVNFSFHRFNANHAPHFANRGFPGLAANGWTK